MDNGTASAIEKFIVDTLAALTVDGKAVFKTVDHWRHQIAGDNSGFESIERFAPFAFVAWYPPDAEREGDYDLNQVFRFGVFVGQNSRQAGDGRIGDSLNMGVSELHDRIIAAVENTHPGSGVQCDNIHFIGTNELLDSPKAYAVQMMFKANYITD